MSNRVVWSERAKKDLIAIKSFYDSRNQSTQYSTKLLKTFKDSAKFIEKYPNASIQTDIKNIRGFIIHHYIIYFQIIESNILILTVWDCRRDPSQLKEWLK